LSPSKVEPAHKRGWIVPVGGAEDKVGPSEVLKRFLELAGGDQARVVIIPTASSLEDTGSRYEKLFRKLGADEARSLPFDSRSDAGREEWLKYLEQASGIFLTGGNQLRLSSILGGTEAARLIRKANARGVIVAGTSAGAAILCEHMIAHGGEGATPVMGNVGLAPGFGLTNKVVIDQHFRQRDRLGRLLSAIAHNPFAVGIGLDEDTAAFIDPHDVIHAEGNGAITILDGSQLEHSSIADTDHEKPICITNVRLHILTRGATFDIGKRHAHPPSHKR
jgi:cyanophycinase